MQQGDTFLLLEVNEMDVFVMKQWLATVCCVMCSALQCEKQIPQTSIHHSKHEIRNNMK